MTIAENKEDDWRAYAATVPEAKTSPQSPTYYTTMIDVVANGRFTVGIGISGRTVTELLQDAFHQSGLYVTPEYIRDRGCPLFRVTLPVVCRCITCNGNGKVRRAGRGLFTKVCPTCKGKNSEVPV